MNTYNLSVKDKRYILTHSFIYNDFEKRKFYKNIYINKLLNKKYNIINKYLRHYNQKKKNKLQNSLKRLSFIKPLKNNILSTDIIRKIFESRKILEK